MAEDDSKPKPDVRQDAPDVEPREIDLSQVLRGKTGSEDFLRLKQTLNAASAATPNAPINVTGSGAIGRARRNTR